MSGRLRTALREIRTWCDARWERALRPYWPAAEFPPDSAWSGVVSGNQADAGSPPQRRGGDPALAPTNNETRY